MIVLEFLLASCVCGLGLAVVFRLWDNWREKVQAKALEEASK